MKQSHSILLAFVAAAAVSAAPVARAQTKLVYGNVTSVTLSQGVIVAAKALGFFKEEGIDVEIVEFNGTGTLLPQMTAKRVQVGYPNPDVLMISRQPGKDPLPVKYFYNATRESAWEFIVPADSPIKDLKDLKGKKIGVGALSFGNIPITKAMFKELGFEAELLPVGVGAPAFLAFREKRVDALNLFDSQHATLEVQGTAIRRLAMPKKYKDLFSNGFVAHEDMIRDDPKPLIAFGRAIAKTSVFCEANRAACVKAFWTLYPNQKPTSGDEATNIRNAIKIMDARFNKYLDFDDQKHRRWGEFPAQAWKDFAATLYEGGQLSTKDIPVETCYTNALVPEMNRFDSAAIVARAKGRAMSARILLLALGLWCAAAGAQQKITFGLVSPLTVVNGQLLVAKYLGYLAEEGIEVETIVFNGSAVLLPQIVAKRVTVGFPNPDPLVISRQPGKDPLPLKFIYNVIRENVWEFAVLAGSPVKTLADLKGRKIGVGALTFGNIPLTRAMFKEMGLEVGRDLELVPTGLGAPAFLALKDGRVDALNLFETMHTQLETQGTALRRLKMPQKYLDLFSNGIIAHEDTIRTNPKLLAAFGRALAKATLACNVNRPGCVKAAWKEDPSLKPPGANEAKILADSVALLNARYDKYLAFPKGEAPRWGEYPAGAWKNMVQVMADGGQIQTTAIDLNSLYTNALVPAMNNFDPAAVLADAKKLP